MPLCSQDEEPLGQGCPWLLHSGAGTGLGDDIPRRQNPRRPGPSWESVEHVSPHLPEWLRDLESPGRQVPLQELSNELLGEEKEGGEKEETVSCSLSKTIWLLYLKLKGEVTTKTI